MFSKEECVQTLTMQCKWSATMLSNNEGDPIGVGKSPIEKARTDVLSLAAKVFSPTVHAEIKQDQFLKRLSTDNQKKARKKAKENFAEKTNNILHALEIKPMLKTLEQEMWKETMNLFCPRELSASLRNMANFLTLVQTCARNDSLRGVDLSDLFC